MSLAALGGAWLAWSHFRSAVLQSERVPSPTAAELARAANSDDSSELASATVGASAAPGLPENSARSLVPAHRGRASSTDSLRTGGVGFSGRAVDATSGRGIPDAKVDVFEHMEDVPAREELAAAIVSTDREGRFSLVGVVAGRRHVVTVSAPGFASEVGWCTARVDPYDFALWPAGTVRGSLHPPCRPWGAEVSFWEVGDMPGGWSERRGELDDHGRFLSEPLPAGSWVITVGGITSATPPFRVAAGQQLELGVVDLSQHVACLSVTDVRGAIPEEVWARASSAAGAGPWLEASENGRVGVELDSEQGTVEVFAPGHDLVRLTAMNGQTLRPVLVPHEPLLLRLRESSPSEDRQLPLAVRLFPRSVADFVPPTLGELHELAPLRATTVSHCGAGSYDLQWFVRDSDSGWRLAGSTPFAVPAAGGIVEASPPPLVEFGR